MRSSDLPVGGVARPRVRVRRKPRGIRQKRVAEPSVGDGGCREKGGVGGGGEEVGMQQGTIIRRKRRRDEPVVDELIIKAPAAKRALGEAMAAMGALTVGPLLRKSLDEDASHKAPVQSYRLRRVGSASQSTAKSRTFARELFSTIVDLHEAAKKAVASGKPSEEAKQALSRIDGKFAVKEAAKHSPLTPSASSFRASKRKALLQARREGKGKREEGDGEEAVRRVAKVLDLNAGDPKGALEFRVGRDEESGKEEKEKEGKELALMPLSKGEQEQDEAIYHAFRLEKLPLGKRAEERRVEVFDRLMKASLAPGRNPSFKRRIADGCTALMAVSYHGEVDLVRRLLSAGASIHSKDQRGRTAWTFAQAGGHAGELEELLAPRETKKELVDEDGEKIDYYVLDPFPIIQDKGDSGSGGRKGGEEGEGEGDGGGEGGGEEKKGVVLEGDDQVWGAFEKEAGILSTLYAGRPLLPAASSADASHGRDHGQGLKLGVSPAAASSASTTTTSTSTSTAPSFATSAASQGGLSYVWHDARMHAFVHDPDARIDSIPMAADYFRDWAEEDSSDSRDSQDSEDDRNSKFSYPDGDGSDDEDAAIPHRWRRGGWYHGAGRSEEEGDGEGEGEVDGDADEEGGFGRRVRDWFD